MKFCTSCGSELIKGAEFCSSCGAKVGEPGSTKKAAASLSTDEVKEKVAATVSSATASLQKNTYFNYFQETAKRPSSGVLAEGYNGWIHLAVLAFVTAFSFYAFIRGSVRVAMGAIPFASIGSGYVNSFLNDRMGSVIVRIFIASFVVYIVFVLAAYFMLKFTAKNLDLTFMSVVNRFSGLLTPNILILLVASLLSLVLASDVTLALSLFLIFFSVVLGFLAYNYFIYSETSVQGLDQLYVLLISNILILFTLGLLLAIQIYPIFSQLEEISRYLF